MRLILVTFVLLLLVFLALYVLVPVGLYIRASVAGVKLHAFRTLMQMNAHGVPARELVHALIRAKRAGLDVDLRLLEAHHLAGGRVDRVVDAALAAQQRGEPVDVARLCDQDLRDQNVTPDA